MKQLILSLLLAVCTVCNAQTNHMKFKGIPIEGTLDSFVQKLKSKGFTYLLRTARRYGSTEGRVCCY